MMPRGSSPCKSRPPRSTGRVRGRGPLLDLTATRLEGARFAGPNLTSSVESVTLVECEFHGTLWLHTVQEPAWENQGRSPGAHGSFTIIPRILLTGNRILDSVLEPAKLVNGIRRKTGGHYLL